MLLLITTPVSPSPDLPADTQREILRRMRTIRRFEERASAHYLAGKIYGVVHCYIGGEEVAVGRLRGRGEGVIVPSPARGQPFEMQASALRVVGWVEDSDTYPIQPKPHTLEFLREVAHLRPPTNVIGAATRVRHSLAQATHRLFDEHGFFWVNTPIITTLDAEGAGALFRVSTLDLANLPRTPRVGSISRRISLAARRS